MDFVPHIFLFVLLNTVFLVNCFHGKGVESVNSNPELLDFIDPHCRLANSKVIVYYVLLVERKVENFDAGERELLNLSQFLEEQEDGSGLTCSREGYDESKLLLIVGKSAKNIVNDPALQWIRTLQHSLDVSVSFCFITRH